MEEFLAVHSISCEAFPYHQTDSRSVGKFVPVESGNFTVRFLAAGAVDEVREFMVGSFMDAS